MVLPDHVFNAITQRGAMGGETSASDLQTIKDWLDNGGDIDDVDSEGATILNLSLIFARIDDVKWVISQGADVNKPSYNYEETPLLTAVACDQIEFVLEVITLLLDAGAHINATTAVADDGVFIAGETALSYAFDWFRYDRAEDAERGLAYVPLLLRRGAKLDGCWGGRSAEDCLRHVEDPSAFPGLEDAYSEDLYAERKLPIATKRQFVACKKMIADERRRRYMLPRRAFLRLRSLALRGRAKPDALLATVARLPNELAWHVLSYWPAEAD